MAMTIGDANDLNTVLRWFLGLRAPGDARIDDQDLSDAAEQAAARLADRAYAALTAGLRGGDVLDAWQHLELQPWLDSEGPA